MNPILNAYMNSSRNPLQYAKRYLRLILFAIAGFAIMSILGFILVLILFFNFIVRPLLNGTGSNNSEVAPVTTVESVRIDSSELETKIESLEQRIEELELQLDQPEEL